MKKIVSMLCMATLMGLSVNAQKIEEGSLDVLKNEKIVGLQVDYSSAKIHDMSEDEFAEKEQDWYKDKKGIIENVRDGITDECENLTLLIDSKKFYTLRVNVISVSRRGTTVASVDVLDTEGNIVCKISEVSGLGGSIGTQLRLIKQGAENLGENIGKFLYKQLKGK